LSNALNERLSLYKQWQKTYLLLRRKEKQLCRILDMYVYTL
jgi:hypothetical protein